MSRSLDGPNCYHGWNLFNPVPCPECELTMTHSQKRDPLRGTGRTLNQIQGAPHGAAFIWCNDSTDYPRNLAKDHGRGDLMILPRCALATVLQGRYRDGVVIDHWLRDNMTKAERQAWECVQLRPRLPWGRYYGFGAGKLVDNITQARAAGGYLATQRGGVWEEGRAETVSEALMARRLKDFVDQEIGEARADVQLKAYCDGDATTEVVLDRLRRVREVERRAEATDQEIGDDYPVDRRYVCLPPIRACWAGHWSQADIFYRLKRWNDRVERAARARPTVVALPAAPLGEEVVIRDAHCVPPKPCPCPWPKLCMVCPPPGCFCQDRVPRITMGVV